MGNDPDYLPWTLGADFTVQGVAERLLEMM
jgi:hypothetical protein